MSLTVSVYGKNVHVRKGRLNKKTLAKLIKSIPEGYSVCFCYLHECIFNGLKDPKAGLDALAEKAQEITITNAFFPLEIAMRNPKVTLWQGKATNAMEAAKIALEESHHIRYCQLEVGDMAPFVLNYWLIRGCYAWNQGSGEVLLRGSHLLRNFLALCGGARPTQRCTWARAWECGVRERVFSALTGFTT